jgi:hypothetical protein
MSRKGKNGGDQGDDDEVGYGRPPKRTRFQPGKSGNPKGRPKGSKGLPTLVQEELKARIPVTEGGVTKRMSKGQAIVKRLFSGALKGELKATALISTLSRVDSDNRLAVDEPLSAAEQKLLNDFLNRGKGRRK